MPPKPGGAKRIGGGAKRVGGGAKAGGAKKGGVAGKAGAIGGRSNIGGGLSLNVRSSHLVGAGSSLDLIKPIGLDHVLLGNQYVRDELKRNSRSHERSPSSEGAQQSALRPRSMKGLSLATDRMASEMGRSMSNLFLDDDAISNFDAGSSLNLSGRKSRPNSNSSFPEIDTGAPPTNLSKNPLQSGQIQKSRSNIDISSVNKDRRYDPLSQFTRGKPSILSPIISIDSLTSSKTKREEVPSSSRLQNTVGDTALTSNTPTALSSHMDPRLLQAASGITGTGLMSQISGVTSQESDQTTSDVDMPTDHPISKPIIDAAALASHPEQIGEVDEEEAAMLQDERIPSDLMRAKLIDDSAVDLDGSPAAAPTMMLSPPQACSAPPPEDMSEDTPPLSPTMVPQLGTSAPAYSYEGTTYEGSPYGENLYNQQPGYDPLQEQYHMSAPLIDGGMDQMHQSSFPRYQQSHTSYYHVSETQGNVLRL